MVASTSKSSVVAVPATLFVYAIDVIAGEDPPLIGKSVDATNPVSGFNLKFCPLFVTNLILSTVGLKSILANVKVIAGVNEVLPIAVATPEVKFIV